MAIALVGAVAWAVSSSRPGIGADNGTDGEKKPAADAATLERGKLLVTALACGDCHTPRDAQGKPDPAFLLAGHRASDPAPSWDASMLGKNIGMTVSPSGTGFAGPWGTTYARNLTPDPTTGIGGWNDEAFINVLREGRLKPPMPLTYGMLPDEDLKAMFAYLASLKPVKNLVPFRQLAPPPTPGAPPGKATK